MPNARLSAALLCLAAALMPTAGRSQPVGTAEDQGGAVSPYQSTQPSPYRSIAPADDGFGPAPDQSDNPPQTYAPQGYPPPNGYPPSGYPPPPGYPPPSPATNAGAPPPPAPYGAFCDTGPQTSCGLQRPAPVGARCVCPGYGRPTYGRVR